MLRGLFIACCALLVTLVAVYSSSARNKSTKIRELRDELIDKNLFIQRELGKGDERLDDAQALPDPVTGLYTLRFYETFMMKLTQRRVSPVGMIMIRITDFYNLAAEKGLDVANEAVRKTAAILLDQAGDADLCARLRVNELVMLKLKTTEKLTIQSAKELFRELAESGIEAKIAGGFAYKEGVAAADTVTEAAMNAIRLI
jgi:GGDEF domain-containing protein